MAVVDIMAAFSVLVETGLDGGLDGYLKLSSFSLITGSSFLGSGCGAG